jgi:hypothetical protein
MMVRWDLRADVQVEKIEGLMKRLRTESVSA